MIRWPWRRVERALAAVDEANEAKEALHREVEQKLDQNEERLRELELVLKEMQIRRDILLHQYSGPERRKTFREDP